MSARAMDLHKVIEKLDEMQLDALYKVALCFASQNSFDDFTQDENEAINRSFEEMRSGERVSFASGEEVAAHFRV